VSTPPEPLGAGFSSAASGAIVDVVLSILSIVGLKIAVKNSVERFDAAWMEIS
jgi:hypothetical protein